MDLTQSVASLPGVGPAYAEKLNHLGIDTIFDLLYYLPFRYEDRSVITPTNQIKIGETVTVSGILSPLKNFTTKSGRRMQSASLSDDFGKLNIAWFNQVYLTKLFSKPTQVTLYGKIEFFGGKPALFSPQYELGKVVGIVPIYHETEGLSSKWLRGKIATLISQIPEEILPEKTGWKDAITAIHFPKNLQEIETARKRLAFDELFLLQLASLRRRQAWDATHASPGFKVVSKDINTFLDSLPFSLTSSQEKTISEILLDLQRPISMNRLVLGDVGSGKTVIAAVAALVAAKNGFQTLFLAPTQILAQQHAQTIKSFFEPEIADKIIVGTHALLFKDFENVGLVIIDEQHRFGVEQRQALIAKGRSPHVLTMTATPIPRTVALSKYADLDLSVLTEKPKGRQVIKTWVVPEEKRLSAYEWIKKQSGQIFWVCPLVEESETLTSVKSVKSEFEKLQKIFGGRKLGLLHGKMKTEEKNKIIKDLNDHKIDMLVTTPVVEVGVDVAGASIMVIEAAERFGLASLHQLRGRVGRNSDQAYCLLFANSGVDRLKNLESLDSGLELAEVDFRLRGPGQMAGTSQHGQSDFKIVTYADLAQMEPAKLLAAQALSKLAEWPILLRLTKPAKIEASN